MKELILNKKSLIILYSLMCIFALVVPSVIVFACFGFKFHWIALIISLTIDAYILYLCIKKAKKDYFNSLLKFYYNDEVLKYIVRDKEKLLIYINNIEEIYCQHDEYKSMELVVKFKSGENKYVEMSKRNIKRMSKIIKRNISFKRKKAIKKSKPMFKEFVFKEKKKIIFTLFGLLITVLSMLIYFNNKENNILNGMLASISIIYLFFQLYFLYFSEKDFGRAGNIVICIIASIIIFIVIFIFAILFSVFILQIKEIMDILFISFYLCPSFVIVLIIIIIIFACLSYA